MRIGFQEAVQVLKAGQPLAFSTDTVVGIGVSVADAHDLQMLYDIKRRDKDKPIAWLVDGKDAVARYGYNVPAWAHALADAFWPGGLTLVMQASDSVPAAFLAGGATIGLRMPDDDALLRLIETVGAPLATTSANISGDDAPLSVDDLDPRLAAAVPWLDASFPGAYFGSPTASTVVDCTAASPRVLRAGTIAPSDIEHVFRQCGGGD